jgi:DNA (cytosine-5)-methyltransferase 1
VKHLDLFSGIGGFALACQWNGIETIGFVEIDKYCQKVLRKHWPNVPIVEDIRDVETVKEIVANTAGEGCLPKRHEVGITSQAIQETPTRESSRTSSISGITERGRGDSSKPAILITAGFPCQPFSVAGKRQGEEDDRYLWPETLAVIKAVQPSWILLENVTGIINLALDIVLSDLEGAGYAYETLIIPACAVNAWHRRDRVWIVAHSNESGLEGGEARLQSGLGHRLERCNQDVADSSSNGLEGQKPVCEVRQSSSSIGCSSEDWWAVEPELGRVAHGIPHRVDRLKCLGNAIVPQVAYEIIKVIMTGERNG